MDATPSLIHTLDVFCQISVKLTHPAGTARVDINLVLNAQQMLCGISHQSYGTSSIFGKGFHIS